MGQRFFVTSADGTRIAAWRNGGRGPAVIISNGLGTPPEAWPTLTAPDCGLQVATWYYRGTGGGDLPADRSRVRISDHVADLLALMDAEGMDRAVLACWSLGVNVAFETARLHPDRVAGLMAVAGVPGGTFRAMGAPLAIPRPLRHALGVTAARAMWQLGPVLNAIAAAVPLNRLTATIFNHTGFLLPAARPELLLPALAEFRSHDFRWYAELALGAADHAPMDVSFLRVPATFVAGRYDLLTAVGDMLAAAKQVPGAEIELLPGSHFLPLEYPRELFVLLRDLVARTELAAAAG